MDLESESEVEEEERPCEAVKVGVMIKGSMRPLAPDGCRDAAGPAPTVLLTEDAHASDLPPPSEGKNTCARLCSHHEQVYRAVRYRDKCSHVTCFKQAVGTVSGVPLCLIHMGGEAGRAAVPPAPAPGFFASLRKRQRSQSPRGPASTPTRRTTSPAPAPGALRQAATAAPAVHFDPEEVPLPTPPAAVEAPPGPPVTSHLVVRAHVQWA